MKCLHSRDASEPCNPNTSQKICIAFDSYGEM